MNLKPVGDTKPPLLPPFTNDALYLHVSFIPRIHTDSWQSAPPSSFSPVGAGGPSTSATLLETEASLSVLADSSVGFEPPAPPVIDPHHRAERKEQRQHGNQSSSSVDEDGGAFESVSPGGDYVTENRIGGAQNSTDYGGGDNGSGRNRRRDDDCGGSDSRIPGDRLNDRIIADSANPTGRRSSTDDDVGGGGRGKGVLLGVSAAMASGALPPAQFDHAVKLQSSGNDGRKSSQQGVSLGDGDSGGAHRIHHQGQGGKGGDGAARRRVDGGGHDVTPEGGGGNRRGLEGGNPHNEIYSGNRQDEEVGPSASGRGADYAGELARRHVDQALRERAHRRRHRFVTRPCAPEERP